MKKLIEKDKKFRIMLKKKDKNNFILKLISKNINFFMLVRWNAFQKLKQLNKICSKASIVNRCQATINKKTFHKLMHISRYVLLRYIKLGNIYGMRKSSW